MREKHENEILKQQRIAHEEFLKLKKMQSGEIDAGPKPSEVAVVPKTLKEKLENIWYHFGKLIIVAVFLAITLVILIVQCSNRTKYDLQVVYFTYTAVPDSVTENMADYLEKYCDDINKDAEVNVAVINCSCNPNSNNSAKLSKMQAIIAAEPSALLFITDDESIKYFDNIRTDESGFFDEETVKLNQKFYNACKSGEFTLPENLTLRIRNVSKTQIEKDKNVKAYKKASEKIIDSLDN